MAVVEDAGTNEGLRVRLFGIGLHTYWPQFQGLEERLKGDLRTVAEKLERPGVEVVNLGLIDTPEKAVVAGHQFRRADVDLIQRKFSTSISSDRTGVFRAGMLARSDASG